MRGFVCVTKVTNAGKVKEAEEIEEVKEKSEPMSWGVEMDGFDDENMGNGSMRLARE